MYNAPPPNLMQGIHLVQSGRKTEALAYLRHAAQTEVLTAEGWLWLAAATDDLEEYRRCVSEALLLDPRHPVAVQMRDELDRLERWEPKPGGGSQPSPGVFPASSSQGYSASQGFGAPSQNAAALYPSVRKWSRWRAAVLLLIVGVAAAVIAVVALSGVIQDTARQWLDIQQMQTLDFTVGELPGYHFRVEVPQSWVPANTDNQSWRDRRDVLMAVFPAADGQSSAWEQVEASFVTAVVDPFSGRMLPPIRVVETDEKLLNESAVVPALTLREIMPFPSPPQGTAADACARMRLVEDQFRAGGNLTSQADMTVIEEKVIARKDQRDCVFRLHRRYLHGVPPQTAVPLTAERMPDTTREITLAVPVGADRYALWQITFADSAYGEYAHAVDLITQTLEYLPAQ
jgi:hypothetical protein